jgi:hypothetical protein
MFNVLVTRLKPTSKSKLYSLLRLRYLDLNYNFYEGLFNLIAPILLRKCTPQDAYVVCHTSFIEWFTDVKFSTTKYKFNLNEGHFILALHYLKSLRIGQVEKCDSNRAVGLIKKFKLSLYNSPPLITAVEFEYLHSFISMFDDCFASESDLIFQSIAKGEWTNDWTSSQKV